MSDKELRLAAQSHDEQTATAARDELLARGLHHAAESSFGSRQPSPELREARATLAKREEDFRIARKHEQEAAARIHTPENRRAYIAAREWADACAERARVARARVIWLSLAEAH